MQQVFQGMKYIIVAKPDISLRRQDNILENLADMNKNLINGMEQVETNVMNKVSEILKDVN